MQVPEDWDNQVPMAVESSGDCSVRSGGSLSDDDRTMVTVRLISAGCDPVQPLNGNLGIFTSPADVPDPVDMNSHDLDIGTLTTFKHTYTECTNDCTDYTYSYALVELAHPADPVHTTLLLTADTDILANLDAMATTLDYHLFSTDPGDFDDVTGYTREQWYRPISADDIRADQLAVRMVPPTMSHCGLLWTATDGTDTWSFLSSSAGPVTGAGPVDRIVGEALLSCFDDELIPPVGVAVVVAAFAADPSQPLRPVASGTESGPSMTQTGTVTRYEFALENTVTGAVSDFVVDLDGNELVDISW